MGERTRRVAALAAELRRTDRQARAAWHVWQERVRAARAARHMYASTMNTSAGDTEAKIHMAALADAAATARTRFNVLRGRRAELDRAVTDLIGGLVRDQARRDANT